MELVAIALFLLVLYVIWARLSRFSPEDSVRKDIRSFEQIMSRVEEEIRSLTAEPETPEQRERLDDLDSHLQFCKRAIAHLEDSLSVRHV